MAFKQPSFNISGSMGNVDRYLFKRGCEIQAILLDEARRHQTANQKASQRTLSDIHLERSITRDHLIKQTFTLWDPQILNLTYIRTINRLGGGKRLYKKGVNFILASDYNTAVV
jgi:hypothetical protein